MEADLGKCWTCKLRPGQIRCENCHFALYCGWGCKERDQFRHLIECHNAVIVKYCHNCGIFGETLKCCKGCYMAFYCNSQCQSHHWASDHKQKCLAVSKRILRSAALRQQAYPFCGLPWLVGASLAEDYLRLDQNEGLNTKQHFKLLFVGVGDIRDVTRTIACLPSRFIGRLELVLNDISPHVMARNIVFLYCAIAHQDAANLVQIWYSVMLTETCLNFLVVILKELVNIPRKSLLLRMRNLVDISEDNWKLCLGIWEAWIRLSTEVDAAKRFQKERQCKLKPSFGNFNLELMCQFAPQEHFQSLQEFMKTGVLLPIKSTLRQKATHVNPTMGCFNPFNPAFSSSKYKDVNSIYPHQAQWGYSCRYDTEMMYGVRQDCCAFVCWDYQVVKKTVGLKDDIMEMYDIYLTQIFTDVFRSLDKGKVSFHLVVDGFEKMDETLMKDKRFDRICTSNLSDYIPFPRLLKQFSRLLNRTNPCAVLITHHQNWGLYSGMADDQPFHDDIGTIQLVVADCMARPEVMPSLPELMSSSLALPFKIVNSAYVNTYPYFVISYVAEALLYLHNYEKIPFTKSSLAKVSVIPSQFGLRFRDYRKELNHVVPFYRETFTRRVEYSSCGKYCLEWVPV